MIIISGFIQSQQWCRNVVRCSETWCNVMCITSEFIDTGVRTLTVSIFDRHEHCLYLIVWQLFKFQCDVHWIVFYERWKRSTFWSCKVSYVINDETTAWFQRIGTCKCYSLTVVHFECFSLLSLSTKL